MSLATQVVEEARNLIVDTIDQLELDLSGYTVLTEVGSGHFLFTPIIAALANATQVFAWTRDSRYGTANEIVDECQSICNDWKVENAITFAKNERPLSQVQNADIITNLGFVRPLNEQLLNATGKKPVFIPLMCEAWELRKEDIDIDYCRKHNIAVSGTWENHPSIKVFDECGNLAIKMAQEAGCQVRAEKILVWSDDHFGETISTAFEKYGAAQVVQTTKVSVYDEHVTSCDFIFLCNYNQKEQLLGAEGVLSIAGLTGNEGVRIVHLYGIVDSTFLREKGLNIYPDRDGFAAQMTFTLSHLGISPVIRLHTAGLKVGEVLAKGIESDLAQKII